MLKKHRPFTYSGKLAQLNSEKSKYSPDNLSYFYPSIFPLNIKVL